MKKLIALTLMLILALSFAAIGEDNEDRLVVVAMYGDYSSFIGVVKQALVEKGYLLETELEDDLAYYFDEYTELAVKNFQLYKGFEPDGMLTKNQFYWLHRTYYNNWFDRSFIVYITETGTRYHTWDCPKIQNSDYTPMPISINIAEETGYLPCRTCFYPY